MKTLILNQDFTPYDIWPWQKALAKLLCTGSLMQVKVHDRRIRDGAGNLYDVPAVVMLKTYAPNANKPATYSKANIYARDMNRCQYCGTHVDGADRTVDHVIPRAKYNPKIHKFRLSSFENVVTCCRKCNYTKADRTLEQAGMKLMKKPKKITRAQAYKNKLSMGDIPEMWWEYLQ